MPWLATTDKVNDICCTRNIVETGNTSLSRFASLSVPCFIQIGKVILTYNVQYVMIMKNNNVRMITDKGHALFLHSLFSPCLEIQKQHAGAPIRSTPQVRPRP